MREHVPNDERWRPGESKYLRREAAAAYLGVSPRTLSNLMARRAIPYFKVSRGIVLFSAPDLDEALERYRVRPVGEEL